jgi:hypothetical protein
VIAAVFLAGLVPGVGIGVLIGRRVRLAYRELNDWLGEWAEARKGADLAEDQRVISDEHPVVDDDLNPEVFVSEGNPPEPYCPCGGQCHRGPNPCSMSCMAHHAIVVGGQP